MAGPRGFPVHQNYTDCLWSPPHSVLFNGHQGSFPGHKTGCVVDHSI